MKKLIFDHHLDDLRRSGLSDEMISAMNIESLDAALISRNVYGSGGGSAGADGYAIPYPGTECVRYRLSTDAQTGDKPVKYLSPVGADWGLYEPPGLRELLTESNYLIITEGEKKAAKAVQEGFACAAIPGVWMFIDPRAYIEDKIDAGSPLIPRIVELARGKHVIIIADSDAKENGKVQHAMTTFARCVSHQCLALSVSYTPLNLPAADKAGIDDLLCAEGGSEKLGAIIKDATDKGGFISPGYIKKIPYARAATGLLEYLIPYQVRSEPFLPAVIKMIAGDEGDVEYKQTKAPYAWLERNLLVLQKDENGVYATQSETAPPEVLSEVVGVTDDRRDFKVRLRAEDLTDATQLRKYGISGMPSDFQDIMRAQRASGSVKTELICRGRGWCEIDGAMHYMYNSTAISPAGSVDVRPDYHSTSSIRGDFELWRDLYTTVITESPIQAALAGFTASAAAIGFCPEAEPGVMHIFGESGKGKTTTLQLHASLIGNGSNPRESSSQISSWRSTDNGLEAPLAKANDAPVFLDEIHAAPARMDWQSTAYMIANGRGKSRMMDNAEARDTATWRSQILSTGEVSFAEKVRAGTRGAMPGGLLFRIIDIFAEDRELIKVGESADIFTDILNKDGRKVTESAQLAELIEDTCTGNYGHAWPQIIRWLESDGGERYCALYEKYRDLAIDRLTDTATIIARRRTKHIAAAIAGLDMLCSVLEVDDSERVISAAFEEFCDIVMSAGGESADASETEVIVETISADILSKAISKVFYVGANNAPLAGEIGWCDLAGNLFIPVKTSWLALCLDNGVDAERAQDAVIKAGWEKVRVRHPVSGRGGNPMTCLKAPGMLKGIEDVSGG